MTQGCHQLSLHLDSRTIATFSTPWGNMKPTRLVFGAKSSQDSFDEVIYKIFADIPNCLNQRDDMLLGGQTVEEHDEILEKVLQRAKNYGKTFKLEKCQFGINKLEFYGYIFSKDGLKPTTGKIRAIEKCSTPKSKSDVRSSLGMAGYLSKFIPNYSDLTEPL